MTRIQRLMPGGHDFDARQRHLSQPLTFNLPRSRHPAGSHVAGARCQLSPFPLINEPAQVTLIFWPLNGISQNGDSRTSYHEWVGRQDRAVTRCRRWKWSRWRDGRFFDSPISQVLLLTLSCVKIISRNLLHNLVIKYTPETEWTRAHFVTWKNLHESGITVPVLEGGSPSEPYFSRGKNRNHRGG